MATEAGTKYLRSFGIGLKAGMEYRVNFYFSVASAVSPVVIQTVLWIALYRPGTAGAAGSMFGFTFAQMVAYTVIAQLTGRLVRTGFEYEIAADIKSGTLDRYLVKPIGYFGFRLFAFLGDKVVQLGFMAVLLALAVAVLRLGLGFTTDAANVAGFVAGLPVAFLLNFLVFWCVGMSGFWLVEIGFLYEAARIVILAAAGGIFPLQVLGPRIADVLRFFPFWFTVQFPTELLSGRVDPHDIPGSFAVASGWIMLLAVLAWWLWRRGLRRFAAVGS